MRATVRLQDERQAPWTSTGSEERAQAQSASCSALLVGMAGHIWVYFKKPSQSDEKLQWQSPRGRGQLPYLQYNLVYSAPL